jgi:hypothetical protein
MKSLDLAHRARLKFILNLTLKFYMLMKPEEKVVRMNK